MYAVAWLVSPSGSPVVLGPRPGKGSGVIEGPDDRPHTTFGAREHGNNAARRSSRLSDVYKVNYAALHHSRMDD